MAIYNLFKKETPLHIHTEKKNKSVKQIGIGNNKSLCMYEMKLFKKNHIYFFCFVFIFAYFHCYFFLFITTFELLR